MRISRTKVALGAIAACLFGAGMALGQDSPESLLPPGFNEPVAPAAAPNAPPRPRATPVPGAPGGLTLDPSTLGAPATAGAVPEPMPSPSPTPLDPAAAAALAAAQAAEAQRYNLPEYARRSLDMVGVAGPTDGALGSDAFRGADGIYLETLMRRLNAPIASRWLSIALRRALVSRLDTPARVNGADFAAERAWLLVRMGESVAARAVVQAVDPDNYTPKLYQVAMQTALATGDPGQLCPLIEDGPAAAQERGWAMARAICAALAGEAAAPMLKALDRQGVARGVDLLLTRKIAGMGARGRQAVTIEWDGVDQLTAWRYGLATASGTEIPDTLLDSAGPQVRSWRALSPMLDARQRIAPADYAAARGVLSNAALVDLYGALDGEDDQARADYAVGRDLRTAYTAGTRAERVTALTGLWDDAKTADARYARLILTARAAARLPTDSQDVDMDRLVAAMLSAGLDRTALRWQSRVKPGSDAWAMLALADPEASRRYRAGEVNDYAPAGDNAALKSKLFVAGMAGLGRMSANEASSALGAVDVPVGTENGWTRAIDRAARGNQPGLVILLAAVGMQTSDWRGVPPEVLYRVCNALRLVGLGGQARMIASEAIARL
ncbi:hypothetical protein ACFOKI_02495 [Sphingomonas qilianensis]|uniref:Uncharacterized protein n=1 Tax=Sphingomonas qilianensis TaxID=1736690 RepID=A0ABU9XRS2_9SPHN